MGDGVALRLASVGPTCYCIDMDRETALLALSDLVLDAQLNNLNDKSMPRDQRRHDALRALDAWLSDELDKV